MDLNQDDKRLLQELCEQHDISFDKVFNLLHTVRAYEFKDRRIGIYDDLREILKSDGNTHKEV